MKGIGNYRFATQVERRHGELIAYRGSKATVRLRDGRVYSMPAEPLRKLAIAENEPLVIVVTWQGRDVHDVRVEKPPPVRPARVRQPLPKVVMRDGKRMTTRK